MQGVDLSSHEVGFFRAGYIVIVCVLVWLLNFIRAGEGGMVGVSAWKPHFFALPLTCMGIIVLMSPIFMVSHYGGVSMRKD